MLKNWLLLVHHDPVLDPRISWICNHGPKNLHIESLAYEYDWSNHHSSLFYKHKKVIIKKGLELSNYEQAISQLIEKNKTSENENQSKKIASFIDLAIKLYLDYEKINYNMNLKNKIRFLFRCTSGLMSFRECEKKPPQGIIASDFYTLFAGVYFCMLWDRPLIYEAHEYFSEETPRVPKAEKSFWKGMEKSLLKFTDERFIVTKELGAIAKKELGMPFFEMLNAVPFKT
jgi:hypothetical protein